MPGYEKMKEAVDRFFSDKSRTKADTKDGLETLRDEIEVMIEALNTDIDEEEEEDGE